MILFLKTEDNYNDYNTSMYVKYSATKIDNINSHVIDLLDFEGANEFEYPFYMIGHNAQVPFNSKKRIILG